MKKAGDKVFGMLAFQYKPLEKKMFELLKEQPEAIKKYKEANSIMKIRILDKTAEFLGL